MWTNQTLVLALLGRAPTGSAAWHCCLYQSAMSRSAKAILTTAL
jgi:hypothetical protein